MLDAGRAWTVMVNRAGCSLGQPTRGADSGQPRLPERSWL